MHILLRIPEIVDCRIEMGIANNWRKHRAPKVAAFNRTYRRSIGTPGHLAAVANLNEIAEVCMMQIGSGRGIDTYVEPGTPRSNDDRPAAG